MKSLRILALVILVSIVCGFSLWAQMAIHSFKNFGGSRVDQTPSLLKTVDGGLLMAFETGSIDQDCIGNHGYTDIVVIKMNDKGEKVWSRCYGGSIYEELGGMVTDNLGYIYIVGTTNSLDGDLPSVGRGAYDRWIFKLDPTGKLIWSKVYGGSDWEKGAWIDIKSNGNLVTGGRSYSADLDVGSNYGSEDSWILELNSDGEIVHSHVSGTTGMDLDMGGLVCRDDGFLAAVNVMKSGGSVIGPTLGDFDILLLKGDQQLDIEWESIRGGSSMDTQLGDIIELADGYLFTAVSGSLDHDLEFASCFEPINQNWNIWVCKVDGMGSMVWSRCLSVDPPSSSYISSFQHAIQGRSLFASEDGGFMVFSQTFNSNCQAGTVDGYAIQVTKLDSLGNILWQRPLGRFYSHFNASFLPFGHGKWMAAVENEGVSLNCDPFNFGYTNGDVWLTEIRECEYYTTSKPEGDEIVCVNSTPSTQYTTHPYWTPNSYQWTLLPQEAGDVVGEDSIITVNWNASFEGKAQLVVNLLTECGTSKSSDTLSVLVHRDCTSMDEITTQSLNVYFQPNPASKTAKLYYKFPEGSSQAKVSLYDLNGIPVYQGFVSGSEGSTQIDISSLRGGVYQCIVAGEKSSGRCRLIVL